MVPHIGWAITDNTEHKVIMQGQYRPRGNHGYDNEEPDMQAIMGKSVKLNQVAHGPFANQVKVTSTAIIEPFANIEIYNLVAQLLNIENKAPNNGSEGFWEAYF